MAGSTGLTEAAAMASFLSIYLIFIYGYCGAIMAAENGVVPLAAIEA